MSISRSTAATLAMITVPASIAIYFFLSRDLETYYVALMAFCCTMLGIIEGRLFR